MKKINFTASGSSLVVTVSVVATVLVLLGSAVSYTQHVSKISQRTRKTALAMEIADGHLEYLFTHWRNLSRTQVTLALKKKATKVSSFALPTQYFFTDLYNPGPAPVPDPTTTGLTVAPPVIPLPNSNLFPSEPDYEVTQYRIQAVTPMVDLGSNETSTVAVTDAGDGNYSSTSGFKAAFGPNTSTSNGQYSFYYLASADVKVPAIGSQTGYVTAKVRRVFEKKYDVPFTFAMFYVDDLELQPASSLTITGPVHTNSNLYIGTSNFTAATPTTGFPTSGRVTYANMFVNGASPNDPGHTSFTQPNFPSNEPPMMVSTYLPFGWNPDLSGANANSDSYHDLIERPDTTIDDDISTIRFYNQADYHVIIDSSLADPNNIVIYDKTGAVMPKNNGDGKVINEALTNSGVIDQAIIQDVREGGPVLVTSINIGDVSSKSTLGMVYVSDKSAGTSLTKTFGGTSYTTSKRGIRIKNGATISPSTGLTFVSENPVYIQGDYNTGVSPPSNSGTYTSPLGSGYTWKPCAIVADAINVLSNGWAWDNSATTGTARVASNTTINAALVTGNVASDGTNYSGGGENFIRFLENWNTKSFCYYGSMVQFWQSRQATGIWSSSNTIYTAPTTNKWYYDIHFAGDPTNPTGNNNPIPPGNPGFQLAAYLQQQRWYQVY
jgi:hypothetical protein